MGRDDRPASVAGRSKQPGPKYDDAMRMLVADDLPAVLSLVGVHDRGAQLLSPSLEASTRTADLVVRTGDGIVHVEFVKDVTPDLTLRMIDYWLRLRRDDRDGPIRQVILVLGDVRVPHEYRDPHDPRRVFPWDVTSIRELDPEVLLHAPTTAAVAALCRGSVHDRAAALVAAVDVITEHTGTDRDRRAVLIGAATALASIVLPTPIIDTATKEAVMPVPVRETPLGRELLEEGREEGREAGREAGREEGRRQATVRFLTFSLRQRFGQDPRIAALAEHLAALPDEDGHTRIAAVDTLDDLMPPRPRRS